MTCDDFHIRPATSADTEAIVAVCSEALAWKAPDFDRALFEWKHFTNAFGQSLMLVAERDGEIAAVRPFMRWRFSGPEGVVTAARAVDTATHPSAQGKGLFRRLTERGLDLLREEGVDFVFNTPNGKSLPGYLKMGWVEAGRVGFGFGFDPKRPASLARVARSKTAADKPSLPTDDVGVEVADALRSMDPESLATATSSTLTTDHTVETLLWRFASGPIDYRYVAGPPGTGIIVRLRRRGHSRELVVAHLVGPLDNNHASDLIRTTMRQLRADVYLAPATIPHTLTLTRLGPTLALRTVTTTPNPSLFNWLPGDIELF